MTPREYIKSLDEPRRSEMQQLHDMIVKALPKGTKIEVDRGMVGYGPFTGRYASGHEFKSALIGISSRKQYISIYANTDVAAKYRDQLPNANCGVSCIRLRKLADADPKVLLRVIRESANAVSA